MLEMIRKKYRKAFIVSLELLLVLGILLGAVGAGLKLLKDSVSTQIEDTAKIVDQIVPNGNSSRPIPCPTPAAAQPSFQVPLVP